MYANKFMQLLCSLDESQNKEIKSRPLKSFYRKTRLASFEKSYRRPKACSSNRTEFFFEYLSL